MMTTITTSKKHRANKQVQFGIFNMLVIAHFNSQLEADIDLDENHLVQLCIQDPSITYDKGEQSTTVIDTSTSKPTDLPVVPSVIETVPQSTKVPLPSTDSPERIEQREMYTSMNKADIVAIAEEYGFDKKEYGSLKKDELVEFMLDKTLTTEEE